MKRATWPAVIDVNEVRDFARRLDVSDVTVVVRLQVAPNIHVDCDTTEDASTGLSHLLAEPGKPPAEIDQIRAYLIQQCGMQDVGTTLDMVRSLGYAAWSVRQPRSEADGSAPTKPR